MKMLGIGILICSLFLISCDKSATLYQGELKKVEYHVSEGWGRTISWVLTFQDGMIYTISKQPPEGLQIGKIYEIYTTYEGYYRASRKSAK